ncbi:MAG: hypothetical protein ACK5AC_05265 [Planctomycetota bacterium]
MPCNAKTPQSAVFSTLLIVVTRAAGLDFIPAYSQGDLVGPPGRKSPMGGL